MIFDTLLDVTGIRKGLEKIKGMSSDELSGAGSVFEQTGGKLTKYITKPALGAAAALSGLSLVKGFNRLKNIDTAKAQLEGLGHSAKEVEAIMDSAMQAVKGTAYGFDEAATAAASAVAAGIKPGQELTRYLGLVGDAAAQSKLSFTDMGSIFNKVMASGKISMEEVNQLADQGIPIYKMLSEQLGVTQADVREMVSAGKVDSETFLAAIEANIGGAAKIMGEKSFTGALANIGASLSRIGANFLDAGGKGGGFFSQLKPLMADLMDTLAGLEDKAAVWGEKFGKAFSTVVKVVSAIPAPILAIGTAMAVSAGPALQLAGKILKSVGAIQTFKAEEKAMSTLAGIANGKLTVQQALAMKLGEGLKKAASSALAFVKNLVTKITTTVTDTATTTANTVATTLNGTAAGAAAKKVLAFASAHKVAMLASLGLVGALVAMAVYMAKSGLSADEMAAKITGFADMAAAMIMKFAAALPQMLPQLTAAFVQVINSLVGTLPTLIPALLQAAISLFMALVDALPTVIQALVVALPTVILAVVNALVTALPTLLQAAITLFMALVEAIPTVIQALVDALPTIIQAIVDTIPVLIPALIQAAITLFMAFIEAIPTIVSALIHAMPQLIMAIVTGLLAGLGQIFSVGVQLLKRLWSGISSWAGSLKSKVKSVASSLPGKIKDGIGSLVSIGKNWIEGLWNGIKDKKDWLCNKIKSVAKSAKDAIKDFFGIKSPSTVMRDEVGIYIPEGIGVGIQRRTKSLIAQARAQAAEVKSAYAEGLGAGELTTIGSRFATAVAQDTPVAAEPANVEQTFNFYQPFESPIEVARRLKQQAMYGLAGDS